MSVGHEKGCNDVTVVCPREEVFSFPSGSDTDQAVLPDHVVGMELTLEHLPDDPVCVPVSTESYARRL
jgi:hypothetical protein